MRMLCERLSVSGVPALVWGAESERVFLYVHGKFGRKEEAEGFARLASEAGWQTLSVDLPGHGERPAEDNAPAPWRAVPELERVMSWAGARWARVALYAGSIGAWLSMMAFERAQPCMCLFVSPILDMEKLILGMMAAAQVTEERLMREGEIITCAGDTLSMRYLEFARARAALSWRAPTRVLFAERDSFTSLETAEAFCARTGGELTVVKDGEHWFHTPRQLEILEEWTRESLRILNAGA